MWRLCSKNVHKDIYEEKTPPPVWCPLRCTLEELYSGVQRRIKFTGGRMVILHDHGEISSKADPEGDILVVNIAPGSKNGDKIVFPRRVTVEGGKIPGDLIFAVIEEPHAVFERRGNDLWVKKKVPLMEYLTKQALTIETLDKRPLTVLKTEPDGITEILDEGMPLWHHGMKGSLFVGVEVVFPKNLSLTNEEKDELKRLLSKEEDD